MILSLTLSSTFLVDAVFYAISDVVLYVVHDDIILDVVLKLCLKNVHKVILKVDIVHDIILDVVLKVVL